MQPTTIFKGMPFFYIFQLILGPALFSSELMQLIHKLCKHVILHNFLLTQFCSKSKPDVYTYILAHDFACSSFKKKMPSGLPQPLNLRLSALQSFSFFSPLWQLMNSLIKATLFCMAFWLYPNSLYKLLPLIILLSLQHYPTWGVTKEPKDYFYWYFSFFSFFHPLSTTLEPLSPLEKGSKEIPSDPLGRNSTL